MSKDTISHLNGLVADFTVFYQKLRHYHWNVKGERFFELHLKFEEIYTQVGDVIDQIAERIVGLEGTPLHTLAHMLDESVISEDPEVPDGAVMVARIVDDIVKLNNKLKEAIAAAEAINDRTTFNLLDGIHDGLEGHLWMLKAWQGK